MSVDTTRGTATSGCARVAAVRRRVLVVDDHRDAARILGLLLDTLGHEVRTAHTGKQAVEQASAFDPEVVLLDITLPDGDGYQVARQLRALPRGAEVKLVALTGHGHEDDRRRSFEAGFDHHLVKPVGARALQEVIEGTGAAPAAAR
jgi:CheY-like chemotaxis protein